MDRSSEERRRFWDEKHSDGAIEGDRLNPFFVELLFTPADLREDLPDLVFRRVEVLRRGSEERAPLDAVVVAGKL